MRGFQSSLRITRSLATRPARLAAVNRGTRAYSSLMDTTMLNESQIGVREGVMGIVEKFPDAYWRERDQTVTDPNDFHQAIADGGWLGIALPEKFGGSGLGISEAAILMQTITESGAGFPGAQAIHGNIYATQPLGIFGTDEQRSHFIPRIVSGEYRTCFAVTEPSVGLNTLELKVTATQNDAGDWVINGQKVWITCAQNAKVMMLLARTTPLDQLEKKSRGLSLFVVPLDKNAPGLTMKRINKMGGKCVDSNEVWFDNYVVPKGSIVGGDENKGKGFHMILHGMNAERILIGAEALGIGYAALQKAATYAAEREVFGRPIGKNQGIAHPLADLYMQLHAAGLAVYHAAKLYDASQTDKTISQNAVGAAANTAKYLAAEAGFKCAERAILTHGGMGFAAEYDVERYFRESLVPRLAPISREMILNYISERVLSLPKSY